MRALLSTSSALIPWLTRLFAQHPETSAAPAQAPRSRVAVALAAAARARR